MMTALVSRITKFIAATGLCVVALGSVAVFAAETESVNCLDNCAYESNVTMLEVAQNRVRSILGHTVGE